MEKNNDQLELNFKEVQKENSEASHRYSRKAKKDKTIKPDCGNPRLSKTTGKSKVKAELPKAPGGLEAETASDETSEEATLFDNLITTEELAVILGLAPQTIRNWVALGKLPYVKVGRRNLFLGRSLREWLNRKEEPQWE